MTDHVHRFDNLDFLEGRSLLLRGGGQAVDPAGDLDLFPVVDQDKFPGVHRGVRILSGEAGDVRQFRQRRIGAGDGHRRTRDQPRDPRTERGIGNRPAGILCSGNNYIDNSLRIGFLIGQYRLDDAVVVCPAALHPGRNRRGLGAGAVRGAAEIIDIALRLKVAGAV